LSLTDEELQDARQYGLEVVVNHGVGQPGAYQVRVAVRDVISERLGTAWQFLIAPDLSKNDIALLSVTLAEPPGQREAHLLAQPVTRVFHQDRQIDWASDIYNPSQKRGERNLTSLTRLYRDGALVSETTPAQVSDQAGKNENQIHLSGSLSSDQHL